MTSNPITKKQKLILDTIESHIKEHGFTPSYREIAAKLKLASPATVYDHIQKLKKKGFLSFQKNSARSVVITDVQAEIERAKEEKEALKKSARNIDGGVELPLIGLITAGQPIEALENNETMVVPANLVIDHQNTFVLRVKGDSMKDDGILDGDFVLIERNPSPKDGDIVVALLDNMYATLKRFYREANRIRLQPANKGMQPIYCYDPLIQGVVRAVIRKYQTAA